jgi:hypothetical protein
MAGVGGDFPRGVMIFILVNNDEDETINDPFYKQILFSIFGEDNIILIDCRCRRE